MFGPRLTRIFASRWNALWWAAGILLLAWQVVPDADDQPPTTAVAPTANPWGIDTPDTTAR